MNTSRDHVAEFIDCLLGMLRSVRFMQSAETTGEAATWLNTEQRFALAASWNVALALGGQT